MIVWGVYLEIALMSAKGSVQNTVVLSVTEEKLMAAVSCAQNMLYARRIFTFLGLKVKLPMLLEIDNKGTVDLINNWSVGGITRHVETRKLFLREIKDQGIFQVSWIIDDDNEVDLFTKNLPGSLYIIILLIGRSMCPDGIHILGWWCFTPYTEAKESLDSFPI